MLRTYDEISSDVLSRITTLNVDVWPSKYDVVDEEGIFRLLHYHPLAEEKYRTPILIAYAFITDLMCSICSLKYRWYRNT